VHFGENQVKTIPPIERQTPAELLKEAEEEQKNKRIKTLDLSRGPSSLRTFVQNLEKSIAKNELQRVDYADQPEKFMESELALYEDIAVMNDLATNAGYYSTFVELGAVDQLLALLGHENVDVALAVVRLFVELLDPTLLEEDEQGEIKTGMVDLIEAFVGTGDKSNGGIGMVVANLSRLHEQEEEEVKGIEDIFTLMENLMDLDQIVPWKRNSLQQDMMGDDASIPNDMSIVANICKYTSFVSFLLLKLGNFDSSHMKFSLRLHAAELLATILQHEDSRKHIHNLSDLQYKSFLWNGDMIATKKAKTHVDGIEYLLQCVAKYRKKDPASEEECEYLENIFDGLAASLLNEKNVEAFLERQGIELMLKCLSERVHSGYGAFKVLGFALTGPASSNSQLYKRAAEIFVEAGGFKSFFPIFMGRKHSMPQPSENCDAGNVTMLRKYAKLNKEEKQKPSRKMKQVVSASKEWYRSLEANAIQILYGLTRHLDDNSPNEAKHRLLAKFVENDCEKCDRMIELCLKYDAKMRRAEYLYFRSDEAEEAEASGIDVELAALNAKFKGE
jgi:Histidyl-tRNA synthetase